MNITTTYQDLPTSVSSFVVENDDLSYTIVLNSRLNYEKNLLSYHHELNHILNGDFEKTDVNVIENNAHNIVQGGEIYEF